MSFLDNSYGSPSSESLPSTSRSGSNGQSPSNAESCPICGDVAWNKHFGVLCCNACAAFFRRTVALRKSYICVRGKNCDVTQGEPRHMCKFCRYQRCIWTGMCIEAVFTRPQREEETSIFADGPTLLRRLAHCRSSLFVERYSATIKIYNGQQELVRLGKRCPDAPHMVRAVQAEFMVVMGYLKKSGFPQLGISGSELTKLGAALFYQWMCFNTIANTLKNGGHNTNEIYHVDESHLPVTFESVQTFVGTFKPLCDPKAAGKNMQEMPTEEQVAESWNMATMLAYRFYASVINAVMTFHRARLDATEFAVMGQIIALKMALRIFPERIQLQKCIDYIFEAMRTHYEENFDDVAVRLGGMILLIDEIEVVTNNVEEFADAMTRNGYETVLGQILKSQFLVEEFLKEPKHEDFKIPAPVPRHHNDIEMAPIPDAVQCV